MNSDEVLTYFSKWIEKELGIVYEQHNLYQLQDRLDQLARHFRLASSMELWQKAQAGISGEFRQLLIDISTNNETSFFRDLKFFECLERTIIPRLLEEKKGLTGLNIWSVASSSGQEPYSLAMILADFGIKLNQPPPRILATDISEKILARAKAGRYSETEVNRGLSPEQRKRYFTVDVNNNWLLDAKLKQLVDFQSLNLRIAFSLGKQFDLILCRNVLIYQRIENKVEIIKRISAHLRPGGIFLLGSGESLIGLSGEFEQSLVDGVAVYIRKDSKSLAA